MSQEAANILLYGGSSTLSSLDSSAFAYGVFNPLVKPDLGRGLVRPAQPACLPIDIFRDIGETLLLRPTRIGSEETLLRLNPITKRAGSAEGCQSTILTDP